MGQGPGIIGDEDRPVGLEASNFAMAGAREGFGPVLGDDLQGQGFDPAATGVAMSLAGAARSGEKRRDDAVRIGVRIGVDKPRRPL